MKIELLLTACTQISHHDPATQDGSNILTFNRQKQFVERVVDATPISQIAIDRFCSANPVPDSIIDIVSELSFAEFASVALVKLFMDTYNSAEGAGLFSGMERYGMLEGRLHAAAIRATSLPALWNRLTTDMRVPIQPTYADEKLAGLFALPRAVKLGMIASVLHDHRSAVTIARLWHGIEKQMSQSYSDKAGTPQMFVEMLIRQYDAAQIIPPDPVTVIEVPAVSANSLRHQIVREPAWQDLWQAIGLTPGVDAIPTSAEALFVNGGNIKAGAKQPRNAFALASTVRKLYPSLELLGGVTDSFDLGESRLSVSSWLVCKENADALRNSAAADLDQANISAFDMLDDVTATRQATDAGIGQMIYNYETLAKGTMILCCLHLNPYTSALARGALLSAIDTYSSGAPTVGGQAARGLGHMDVVIPHMDTPDPIGDMQAYRAYLHDNADKLREGLINGTLGLDSGKILS